MRLFEHEGKQVLQRFGIKTPVGCIATTSQEVKEATAALGKPVVIKSQVLSGGRGKAGGIKFAANPEEAKAASEELLGKFIKGEVVKRLLIEEQLTIAKEFYMGFTIDSVAAEPIFLMSPEGGIDIEEINKLAPQKVGRRLIDMAEGFSSYMVREMGAEIGIKGKDLVILGDTAYKLYRAFLDYDALIAEINPLVLTNVGEMLAADAKFELDDDAAARHPEFTIEGRIEGETDLEKRARQQGIRYLELDGNIGIAGNGAGLMMTTVDVVEKYGGRAANFVDAGGARAVPGSGEAAIDWWDSVIQIVLANPKVKVFFFNLHGGNHRGDEVAQGIIRALKKSKRHIPVVIRLSGTRQEEGRAILTRHGYNSFASLDEAAKAAAHLAQGVND